MNRGLLFLAGVLAGALGSALLRNAAVRPLLLDMARGVMDAGDMAAQRVEMLREDVEDLLDEARKQSVPAQEPEPGEPRTRKRAPKGGTV